MSDEVRLSFGASVWWRIRGFGYGYVDRVPAEFREYSRSGKRALIQFYAKDDTSPQWVYVKPENVVPR